MFSACSQKPCPPETLIKALNEAVELHDLIISKRILLDNTLRGAVDALSQALSIAKPLFFGRAQRVRRIANELAEMMKIPNSWRVDVAAVFSQLAYLSFPESVSEEVYHKRKLSSELKEIVKRLPEDTTNIIEKFLALKKLGKF